MKILMIAPQFYPLIGGYETSALRLSKALKSRGHDILVITEKRDKNWKKNELVESVPVKRLFTIYKKGFHQITANFSLIFFLLTKGWRFDVFHIHQYGVSSALATFIAKIMKKPVVLKTTSTGSMGISKTFEKSKFRHLFEKSFKKTTAFITTSVSAKQEVKKLGISEEKIYLIPNGVDTEQFKPMLNKSEIRKKFKINNNCFVAVFCGRLSEAKNPLGLLDAWKIVLKEVSNSKLLIVGDGEQAKEVKEKIKTNNLENNIRFEGMQSDIFVYYQMSDLFLLPSKTEGLSNSLLEALSCGLPVVSTKVSGSIDIVEKYEVGRLTDVDDMDSFANEIINLYRNKELRMKMSENARIFAEKNISINAVAKKTEELYLEITKKR